jgi:hypothetical protein
VDSVRDRRGVAVADFDNDGRLDMFVANANGEPFLYRNTMAGTGHWTEFVLVGTKSNKGAVGAQVRITAGGRTQLRFVDGGNGFASQGSSRIHAGFGTATTKIDKVEIRWPSGERQTFENIPADRIMRVTEGRTAPETLKPGGSSR